MFGMTLPQMRKKKLSNLPVLWKDLKQIRQSNAGFVVHQKHPTVAKMYSQKMGGVDRNNRGAEMYRISRQTNKWRWAVFWHLMDSLIHNAWVLMYPDGAGNDRKKQQLQFRINLAKQLIGTYSCRRRERSKDVRPAPFVQHYPERRPIQARCVCKCGRVVKIGCDTCKVPLAIECFRTYSHGS